MKGAKFKLYEEIDTFKADSGKKQNEFNEWESKAIDKEIDKMLKQNIIEKTIREKDDVVSKIFIREKKDKNGVRVILNLKKLNQQLKTQSFKMAGIRSAIDLITPGCFMASIDLVSAYYSVPVHKDFRKYLKFYYKDKLYQFTCLANGLNQAPFMFTLLLKPVYAYLHSLNLVSTYYLDDSLLLADSPEKCFENIKQTVQLFESLGFFVHKEKSCFVPCQEIEYLGFKLNSFDMSITLTDKRKEKIIRVCKDLLALQKISIRKLSAAIGTMVASFIAIPFGKMYYRQLEKEKTEGLRVNNGNWEKEISLSKEALLEVKWWLENANTITPISRGKPDAVLVTDASNTGFGCVYQKQIMSGVWSLEEKEMHINILELKAVLFGLKTFVKDLSNMHIRVRVDNMAALHILNNMGSIKNKKLNEIAKEIWSFATHRHIWLSAEYVASQDNIADAPSRKPVNLDAEWMLNPIDFQKAIKELGFKPNIDLFASKHNKQIEKFISYQPDPEAFWVDAFSLDWGRLDFYAFPPFNIILRVLRKIREDKAVGMVIIPIWKAQPFYPIAMNMLVGSPVILSPRKRLLIMPNDPSKSHRMYRKMKLIAGIFSGRTVRN